MLTSIKRNSRRQPDIRTTDTTHTAPQDSTTHAVPSPEHPRTTTPQHSTHPAHGTKWETTDEFEHMWLCSSKQSNHMTYLYTCMSHRPQGGLLCGRVTCALPCARRRNLTISRDTSAARPLAQIDRVSHLPFHRVVRPPKNDADGMPTRDHWHLPASLPLFATEKSLRIPAATSGSLASSSVRNDPRSALAPMYYWALVEPSLCATGLSALSRQPCLRRTHT